MKKPKKKLVKREPPKPEPPKTVVSVRTIYYEDHYLPALCFRDVDVVRAVYGSRVDGIWDISLSLRDHDKAPITFYNNMPYSVERFVAHMKTYADEGTPISSGARALLQPLIPDLPPELEIAITPFPKPEPVLQKSVRTSGQELIRQLSKKSKLPPEKIRAKLRAAGLRAPYTDSAACHKALGVKP